MICARAWNPEEREYTTSLWIAEGRCLLAPNKPIPAGWIPEYGFMNTDGQPIYHGDILRVSWIGVVITIYRMDTKMSVPRFVFAQPGTAKSLARGASTSERAAFTDSRIVNLGSYRLPKSDYRSRYTKPKPEVKPAVDIYGILKERRNK